jgi:uncharacterized protein YqjF (DUF2071 family)
MSVVQDNIDRMSPRARPAEAAIGYQTWTDLSFLHWRAPPHWLEPLLPRGLTVDTFQGEAWVGLVPFSMSRVRPWWSPPVPGVSWFCETNVRTYVHRRGTDPGVWFFSLDASNSIAVQVARKRWNLNYYRSQMSLERKDDRVAYRSRRLWPGTRGAGGRIEVRVGDHIGSARSGMPAGLAEPGTLEFFLAERYYLYATAHNGSLLRGQVHHVPYPLREASVETCDDSLIRAAGIPISTPPDHVLFSDGVSVEVFALEKA